MKLTELYMYIFLYLINIFIFFRIIPYNKITFQLSVYNKINFPITHLLRLKNITNSSHRSRIYIQISSRDRMILMRATLPYTQEREVAIISSYQVKEIWYTNFTCILNVRLRRGGQGHIPPPGYITQLVVSMCILTSRHILKEIQ